MSTGGRKRTRSERVAALELPPSRVERLVIRVRQSDVLLRIGLCLAAAIAISVIAEAWKPPFRYRQGDTPARDVVARIDFVEPEARDPARVTRFNPGQVLVKAGRTLGTEDVRLLRCEHDAWVAAMPRTQMFFRGLASLVMTLALWGLVGLYLAYRQPGILRSVRRFAVMMLMLVVAVAVADWLSADPWRAEIIPPLLFGMTVAIAYSQELSVILATVAAVLLVLTTGLGLDELLVQCGTVTTAVLLLGRIRSRSKLIKVGGCAGFAALLLTLSTYILEGEPLARPVLLTGLRNAVWAIAAGFLMTGLLPFIERRFGVITEISLLELGDIAHPLLQELVRRAPGTYNHSINVASLAEAAADAIGANGLLVRVGAYFHDIGKMFKPGYFVENQGDAVSRHETLVPAMSTLIIIAHVKDGADLARQHHLPRPIVDFIEQHHGTTLVEYFYHRASQQSEANPDGPPVEEDTYRYPGPKPQTREAGVLMLADAVEGASRVLVEPTPARIESLVNEIALKRLHDGQFDECGLDLQELRTIQDSLVKSLTAVYHGRVKYPSQRTA